MEETAHPVATEHVPFFITAPGQTDTLMVVMAVFLLVVVVLIGNFYLQLHSIPERRAHKANLVQMEIVAVLALLALFTHNHIFWVLALLLAMITVPDFISPITTMADSLQKIANRNGGRVQPEVGTEPAPVPDGAQGHAEGAGPSAIPTQDKV